MERKLLANEFHPLYERPFLTEYDELKENIDKDIEYAADDEKFGKIMMAWRLPFKLHEGLETMTAYEYLEEYLTYSTVSPMKEAFVNIEEPLATSVFIYQTEYSQPIIRGGFVNVPLDKMDGMEEKFHAVINEVVEGDFDIERMRTISTRY